MVLRMRSQIQQYTGGPLMCNGYLVEAAPGVFVAIDAPAGFADWLRGVLPPNARLAHLLITHQHFDHIADVRQLVQETACEVHACAPYSAQLTLEGHARSWGIPEPPSFRVVHTYPEGTHELRLADAVWQALHVPGHSTDSLAWYLADARAVFTGDALFAGSIGRTDLPGGSAAQLVQSIREKLLPLPPRTEVLPGHGASSTIGEEEINNPFL